jgi:acetyl-CoA carboxylase biotin carboxyl carrier protein
MSLVVDAQVTGRVVRVEKQVGDKVDVEETLMVLESMKMEIPVEAPSAGTVSEIRVGVGDSVEEGDSLAVLD